MNATVLTVDELDTSLRVVTTADGVTLEVAEVVWVEGQTPTDRWHAYQSCPVAPGADELEAAKARAVLDERYFRTCTACRSRMNVGHMHDRRVCQACATERLGVVY